jgi:hypothetical protein
MAERTPSPPGRPSVDARAVRGRRAADAHRHAIGLRDIGAIREAPQSSSTSSRRPSTPARRPDRLAFYMGYCPHRRTGHVSCGTRDGRTLSRSRARATYLLVVADRRLAGAGPDARVSSEASVAASEGRALAALRMQASSASALRGVTASLTRWLPTLARRLPGRARRCSHLRLKNPPRQYAKTRPLGVHDGPACPDRGVVGGAPRCRTRGQVRPAQRGQQDHDGSVVQRRA